MWRLWNKLFGWHYVTLRSQAMDYRYTRRLRKTANNMMYIEFTNNVWFLLDDGKVDNGYTWNALTW